MPERMAGGSFGLLLASFLEEEEEEGFLEAAEAALKIGAA